ncbi:MAG: LON peptidase substrate-binding domain-containing protein [Pseudomonadales bacterium]|nr:LON peptidase substrate-binding domain-containing protein [Pseudomonadales bacterium]
MTTEQIIPLFPLKSVLFPKGKLPLQIFEQRYLNMISRVLKEEGKFGICLLKSGEEVARPGLQQTVHRIGTLVRIIDWDRLPNGLLGVTVEGVAKFSVKDCWSQDDSLLLARTEVTAYDHTDEPAIPIDEERDNLCGLLQQLMNHPLIDQLDMTVDYSNLREVGWRLAELLPIPVEQKQTLLEINDPYERARALEEIIASMVRQM